MMVQPPDTGRQTSRFKWKRCKQFSVIPGGDVPENTLAASRWKESSLRSEGRELKQCRSLWWRWKNVQRAPRLIPRSGSLGGGPVCPGWKQRRQRQHPRHPFSRRTKAPRLFRQIYLTRLISVRRRTRSDPPRPGSHSAWLSGRAGAVYSARWWSGSWLRRSGDAVRKDRAAAATTTKRPELRRRGQTG